MKEIYLDQGSADWLAWRAGEEFTDILGNPHEAIQGGPRITATAGSVCGGHSPFATPHQLWGEMLGLRKRQVATFPMIRGSALEPFARQSYSEYVGEEYEPLCIQSSIDPWIAASLDGIDLLRTRGVEIKAPMSERVHDMAMLGSVPIYYLDQIQWQMLASDNKLTEIDYFSYAPKIGFAKPITIKIDLTRQSELVKAAMNLRMAVLTRVPLSGSEFDQAAKQYLVLNRQLKALEEQLDAAKERVKVIADGKPTVGGGVIVTVSSSDGRTSWEKVAMELVDKFQVSEPELDAMKVTHKGKPSTTISVKEAADADAVYAELMTLDKPEETSTVDIPMDAILQPSPIW
jgi:putative phage-type endonuclease